MKNNYFFCNVCWKVKHVQFFSHKYDNDTKSKCTECKESSTKNDKPETSNKEIADKNNKIKTSGRATAKRRQLHEALKDLSTLNDRYSYNLEDLIDAE